LTKHIVRLIDWGVKLASVAVTGPATWIVAGMLFDDVAAPGLLFLMRAAAVFLVEGVLLSNWLLLEFDRNATPEIKARYALTALAMYSALLVIAWQHEGPVGLVFRFALLAALIGSGWDTYAYTWRQVARRADRDITESGPVRRHRRRLAIADAKDATIAEFHVARAARVVDTESQLAALEMARQRRLLGIKLDHRREIHELTVTEDSRGTFPYPIEQARARRQRQRLATRDQRIALAARLLEQEPGLSTHELAARLRVAHSTAREYRRALPATIGENGQGKE
jgi:hypothetical protein